MILIHHLRVGRSIFTVWLLEELGLEYELKVYHRLETGRAPANLRDVHPLGKSPILEDDVDGQRVMIAESGAIAQYLIDRYDTQHRLSPSQGDLAAHARWTQWLHYPEGSAFLPVMLQYIQIMMNGGTPLDPDAITAFSQAEVDLHMGYLAGVLAQSPFITGDRFQAPDVGLSFILKMADGLGKLEPYPILKAYLERTLARPAYARALEKAVE